MANKKAIWIGIGSALLLGGGLLWWYKSRKQSADSQNKGDEPQDEPQKDEPNKDGQPKKDTTSGGGKGTTLPHTPFKNTADGNAFRGWMAKNHNDFRYKGQILDTTGGYDNDFIRKAYQMYGAEYEKSKTPTSQPAKGGLSKGDYVYLAKDQAMLYSYPSSKPDYFVGQVEKSFFLDKPIGRYVEGASNGFVKINVGGYRPYNKNTAGFDSNYKQEKRDVFVTTNNITNKPY